MGKSDARNHPLRRKTRPDFESGATTLRLVDLFAGCGGLSLGVAQAARDAGHALEVALAVDFEQAAMDVYLDNFPKAQTATLPLEMLIGGPIGSDLTLIERMLKSFIGEVHAIVGGPPCQGHSDLNNKTRRVDPKNALYLRMVRAAEVFEPLVVMVENVPSVRHSKPDVVKTARKCFEDAGYAVADAVVRMDKLGVPQSRNRHLLLAVAERMGVAPQDVLEALDPAAPTVRNLEWAIGDLKDITDETGFDAAPSCSPANLARMKWMLKANKHDLPNDRRPKCHQDDHSYKSMYGRMYWDRPAQTITSGFTSIGQGRYMHPDHPRALTAHEAARIQSFPDYFDFSAASRRTELTTMIGNAVPPPLAKAVFDQLLPHLARLALPS